MTMNHFGISKQKKPDFRNRFFKHINIGFLIIMFLFFSVFSFYSKITEILFEKEKIDVFREDLTEIWFYFRAFDKDLSKFIITLDKISKWYAKWENIFVTREKELDYCLDYIKNNKDYLKKLWFSNYSELIDLISDLRWNKSELFNLLWKEKAYNYLVVLQNTNEKRPNWWFFWSFAFISIKWWHITNLEIIDSYYPDFVAYNTRIIAPERTKSFLPDRKIWFIAANKFWFTDIDGSNIKKLYEMMFNQNYQLWKLQKTVDPSLYEKLINQDIKWVIFIRSDLIEQIMPTITKKLRERQFVNASIDLIRKEYRSNKKEIYIKETKDFFDKNKVSLFKNAINKFSEIKDNQFLNIYVANTSEKFQNILQSHNLINTFSNKKIYFRDTNVSYNKVDNFVIKNIQIKNQSWKTVVDQTNDIVDISKLWSWIYNISVFYTLNVPEYYAKYIQSLEKKYWIALTARETAILALQPWFYEEPIYGMVKKRRETKSTVYFPPNVQIQNVEWELYYHENFQAPFANGLFYQMWIDTNNTTKSMQIQIEIK